jgi:hypothetical protein
MAYARGIYSVGALNFGLPNIDKGAAMYYWDHKAIRRKDCSAGVD